MSDIKVGDLVAVVRWYSCGCGIGHISKVLRWHGDEETDGCTICNSNLYHPKETIVVLSSTWYAPLSWLKRIPPLSELEGQRTEEGIKERGNRLITASEVLKAMKA